MSRTPAEVMQEEPHIVLHLPRPPSANDLWIPARHSRTGIACMVKSPKYKAWLLEAGYRLNLQHHGDRISGDYALRIVQPPGYDLDNISKATGDLLQAQQIITNDKRCVRLVLDRGDTTLSGHINIHLWSVDA